MTIIVRARPLRPLVLGGLPTRIVNALIRISGGHGAEGTPHTADAIGPDAQPLLLPSIISGAIIAGRLTIGTIVPRGAAGRRRRRSVAVHYVVLLRYSFPNVNYLCFSSLAGG